MTDDDKKRVGAEVDRELYKQVEALGHGAISETIREAFRRKADASVEYELEEKREKLAEVEKQIAEVESDIEATMERLTERVNRHSELTERKHKLEGRIESLETEHDRKEREREEEREGILQELTETLREGMTIFPSHGKVQNAAKKLEASPEEVIEMMKERHPDVPDRAFVPKTEADSEWRGLDSGRKLSSTDSDRKERYPSLVEDDEE